MSPAKVLVVDDQRVARRAMASELEGAGFTVVQAGDGREAWESFQREPPDVVVTDLVMPRADGLDLLSRIRSCSETPVLIVTAHGSIDAAVTAMRSGATDFLASAETGLDRLVELVRQAAENRGHGDAAAELVRRFPGSSGAAERIRRRIDVLAPLAAPVLVIGESGTPKAEVVRALHELGSSADGDLLEFDAERFAPEEVPPTATAVRIDRIERLPSDAQLYWQQALGSSNPSFRAPRLFATSTQPLARDALSPRLLETLGRFRVELTPLRLRLEDLRELVTAFCGAIAREIGREELCVAEAAVPALERIAVAGNEIALQRVLEEAALSAPGRLISREAVARVAAEAAECVERIRHQNTSRERGELVRAIRDAGGNLARAAKLLGRSRSSVYRLIEKHGISLARQD